MGEKRIKNSIAQKIKYMKVNHKTIVVTGAGSGIGRELVLQLLQMNKNVAGVDIHPDSIVETQQIAGVEDDQFRGFVMDITDKAKVENLPDDVIKHFGSVDGIINNAGIIQKFIPVNELSIVEIERVILPVDLFFHENGLKTEDRSRMYPAI